MVQKFFWTSLKCPEVLFRQLNMYLCTCKNPHMYSQTGSHKHTHTRTYTLVLSPECHHLSQAFKSDLGPVRKAIRKESFSGTQKMKSGLILFIFITRPQKVIEAKSWVRSTQGILTAFSGFSLLSLTKQTVVEMSLHQSTMWFHLEMLRYLAVETGYYFSKFRSLELN